MEELDAVEIGVGTRSAACDGAIAGRVLLVGVGVRRRDDRSRHGAEGEHPAKRCGAGHHCLARTGTVKLRASTMPSSGVTAIRR